MGYKEEMEIIIEAEDNASMKINNVASGLRSLEKGIGSFNSALRQYNTSMSYFNHMAVRSVKVMGSAIYDFTKDSIQNYTEFSQQHAKTLGTMASDYDKTLESQKKFLENSEKLKQQALNLGTYGVNGQGSLTSVTGVSELQTELAKAGVSSNDIANTNITKELLQFSQANDIKTSDAVSFAVSLGNQFNVGINKWGEMLDKVSHAADLSIVDVKDIVSSMKYAGGITSGLDRPLEEVLAMISTLGNFGLKGSQAGSGIQAFYTRLLTQDTTFISDRAKKVVPEKALKAFYDFSKYAKSDGSGLTYDQIQGANSYDSLGKLSGNLKPMDEVLIQLDDTMSSLNNEEQAWFAKKLFGLYQMKSAYALINGDDSDLSKVQEEIKNNSIGTNAIKLQELLSSQYGATEAVKNLWEGLKTGIGSDLSNTTTTIAKETYKYLSDTDDYKIDYTSIRKELKKSSKAIEKNWGKGVADAVDGIGGILIDWVEIGQNTMPGFINGIGDVITSAANFDIIDTMSNWNNMIEDMRDSADGLPDDLKNTANAAISVIDAFGKLAAFNLGARILQTITSAMQLIYTVKNMVVKANNVVVSGGTGGTGIGTDTDNKGSGGTVVPGGSKAPVFWDKTGNFWKNSGTLGKILGILSGAYYGYESISQFSDARDDLKSKNYDGYYRNAFGGLAEGIGALGGSFFGPIGTAAGAELGKWLGTKYGMKVASDSKKGNEEYFDNLRKMREREKKYAKGSNGRFLDKVRDADKAPKTNNNILLSESGIRHIIQDTLKKTNLSMGMGSMKSSNITPNNIVFDPSAFSLVDKFRNSIIDIKNSAPINNKITLDNQLALKPNFNVAAPIVNVDVNVDKSGNVAKNINIIDSDFNDKQNQWFKNIIRKNG